MLLTRPIWTKFILHITQLWNYEVHLENKVLASRDGITSQTGMRMRSSREGVCGNNAVKFQSCDVSRYCIALGENAALVLSHANCEIRVIIRFLGNWQERSEIVKRRFYKNACRTLSNRSGVTRDTRPLRSSSCTLTHPSVNCPHHRLTTLSVQYTSHNWRWIFAGHCFWACRNLITARISQLAVDNISTAFFS